jgi:hypothetical protein
MTATPPLEVHRSADGVPYKKVPSLHCIVEFAGGAIATLAGAITLAAAALTAALAADAFTGGAARCGSLTRRPLCDVQPVLSPGATMKVPSEHCATASTGGATCAAAARARTESGGSALADPAGRITAAVGVR